ncbi:MAG: leucyl aminopeptidase family protein [Pseudomonadota bacterium]
MHELLSQASDPKIAQKTGAVDAAALSALDQLVIVVPERPNATLWRKIPQGNRLAAVFGKRPRGDVPALQTRLTNQRQTRVTAGTLAKDASAFDCLTLARQLIAATTDEKPGTLGLLVQGFDPATSANITRALCAAALAAAFVLPSYKQKVPPSPIRRIRILGLDERLDLNRIAAEARGNNLARWLTVMPPNVLDAHNFAAIAKSLAKDNGWQYKRYSVAELQKLGAGAFLAVAQGNEDDSASIVRLRYRPQAKSASPDVALVGKGIIFDTGGTNLKPFMSMLDMHGDMQGSGVALGTFLAISAMQLPLAVDCWLAITENRTGPRAYKSQDVITALNGTTIQTIHTDAEGRMVLADTLTLASREQPQLVIDYATLTGAVINALSTRYSGVFTNRAEWHPRLKRTGYQCGERVWPFPIGDDFLSDLKSDVADIMQCSPNPSADHILAGSFLARFVEHETPWLHVDLAAANQKGGLAHIPTEVTGFGVRYTLSLLLDEGILE